jgi:SnoaL-like domain
MPTPRLSTPIATYFAVANAQDIDAVTACFDGDAFVRDERRTPHGLNAIREWAEEVSKKYRPTVDAIDVAQTNGKTIVTGRVSGNFPGSPIDLRYVFAGRSAKATSWLRARFRSPRSSPSSTRPLSARLRS